MHWIYVLQSKKDNKFYIGSTGDLNQRIKCHDKGKVRSTKSRRPLKLIYSEEYDTVTQARQRENFLKTGQGRKWLKDNILDVERSHSPV
ncbi:MAG: GIY-YIG nuclease family protein [Candidatus Omnitrophota bacterium]